MSAVIGKFCVFRYSMLLRRKTCDRVTSCLAQKGSTAASIVLGSRNPVVGSEIVNVFPLAINGGRYDFFLV
jgi:hypothetical protein